MFSRESVFHYRKTWNSLKTRHSLRKTHHRGDSNTLIDRSIFCMAAHKTFGSLAAKHGGRHTLFFVHSVVIAPASVMLKKLASTGLGLGLEIARFVQEGGQWVAVPGVLIGGLSHELRW